jgi:hypothetical protein
MLSGFFLKARGNAVGIPDWNDTNPIFFVSIAAEMISGAFWTPLEIIKSRQQIPGLTASLKSMESHSSLTSSLLSDSHALRRHLSSISTSSLYSDTGAVLHEEVSAATIAKRIYHREGLCGFMKGYWLSLSVFVPYSGTFSPLALIYLLLNPSSAFALKALFPL